MNAWAEGISRIPQAPHTWPDWLVLVLTFLSVSLMISLTFALICGAVAWAHKQVRRING